MSPRQHHLCAFKPPSAREAVMSAPPNQVLIVDDNADIRQILCDRLEHSGYLVVQAADAETALTLSHGADLCGVLLDLDLPGSGGFSVLAQLREAHPELPVVVMSARRMPAHQALGHGAHAYFSKPLDLELLMVAIRRLFTGPTAPFTTSFTG